MKHLLLSITIAATAALWTLPTLAQTPPQQQQQSRAAPQMGVAEMMAQVFNLGTMTGAQMQGRVSEMQSRIDGLTKELADAKANVCTPPAEK